MTLLSSFQRRFFGLTPRTRARTERSITGAPLMMADLERLFPSPLYEAYIASSIAEIMATPTPAPMTRWRRLQAFAVQRRRLSLLSFGAAAVCIVTGLYLGLYHASNGSHWLLP